MCVKSLHGMCTMFVDRQRAASPYNNVQNSFFSHLMITCSVKRLFIYFFVFFSSVWTFRHNFVRKNIFLLEIFLTWVLIGGMIWMDFILRFRLIWKKYPTFFLGQCSFSANHWRVSNITTKWVDFSLAKFIFVLLPTKSADIRSDSQLDARN